MNTGSHSSPKRTPKRPSSGKLKSGGLTVLSPGKGDGLFFCRLLPKIQIRNVYTDDAHPAPPSRLPLSPLPSFRPPFAACFANPILRSGMSSPSHRHVIADLPACWTSVVRLRAKRPPQTPRRQWPGQPHAPHPVRTPGATPTPPIPQPAHTPPMQ